MTGPAAVGPVTFPPDSYLTYPHVNGFYRSAGVGSVAVGIAGPRPRIVGVDLGSGRTEELVGPEWFPPERADALLWFDVALDSDVLVSSWGDRVIARDLRAPEGDVEVIHEPPSGWTLDGLCSISADGARVLLVRRRDEISELVELDRASGRVRPLVAHPWLANHAHYSPHDNAWVGYAHEGPAGQVSDRLWAWHATQAPDGVSFVDQHRLAESSSAGHVWVGHERWAFHDTAAVVVGYGDSDVGPRGVFLTHPDGRPPVLVSAAERDWHCGISRDGAAVVVDTTGLDGTPGRGWVDAAGWSSVVHIDVATGTRTELARTEAGEHPYHPHPCFTPDGAAVLHNAIERAADGTVRRSVALIPAPRRG